MRDKQRIQPFLNKLGEEWKNSFPDWRFGQLLCNFNRWHEKEYHCDIFYLEEEGFLNRFRQFLNSIQDY